jgi:hypothetical protein
VCRGKCNWGLLLRREMHTLVRNKREGEAQRSTGGKSKKANLQEEDHGAPVPTGLRERGTGMATAPCANRPLDLAGPVLGRRA